MFITDFEDFDFKPMGKDVIRTQGVLLYQDAVVGLILVKDGFECDLASYAVFSKIVFSKLGPSMRPAVLHDMLYRTQPTWCTRAIADRIFREALILDGASKLSAYTQWAGLRAGGWVAWNKHSKRILAETRG